MGNESEGNTVISSKTTRQDLSTYFHTSIPFYHFVVHLLETNYDCAWENHV